MEKTVCMVQLASLPKGVILVAVDRAGCTMQIEKYTVLSLSVLNRTTSKHDIKSKLYPEQNCNFKTGTRTNHGNR